jgi:hypothetical protein
LSPADGDGFWAGTAVDNEMVIEGGASWQHIPLLGYGFSKVGYLHPVGQATDVVQLSGSRTLKFE